MSITTNSTRNQSPSPTLSDTPVMASLQSAPLRRSRPGQVQTNLPSQSSLAAIPPSAISNSSMASSSQQESPILTPETVEVTANSSLQPSPDLSDIQRGRPLADNFPPLQLPDSLAGTLVERTISRKTSTNSLRQGALASPAPSAAGEQKAGLVRRTSNSVRKAAGSLMRRRPSSTHPKSRDGSVGPGVLRIRRPSNSNSYGYNASESVSVTAYSSDEDLFDEREDSHWGLDGATRERDFSPLSATASNAGSTSTAAVTAGPVAPQVLRQGTPICKVSKKKRLKRINLVLDPESAKISWDRTRASKTIYLDDIKEIRTGDDIMQSLRDSDLEPSCASRFFTIIHTVPEKPGSKHLHLVADNEASFQIWTETLEALSKHRQDFAMSLMSFNDKAIRAYWDMEMAKQSGEKAQTTKGTIDFPGVERVCRNLHIHVSQQELSDKFELALNTRVESDASSFSSNSTYSSRLDFSGFLEFVRLMKMRRDVRAIYREHASDLELGLSLAEFLGFIRDVQCEDMEDVGYWESVFARFARRGKAKDIEKSGSISEQGLRMSETSLATYLASTFNSPLPKEIKNAILDRPMNEYYISSSHNTYLLGRQVAGTSSVEGYIWALMRGCRCVEVDCWDGQDDEPVVVHGRTLTSQISFLEVIKTINKYAFMKSKYPLWISLEVRCNPSTQAKMAKIMIDTFAEKLVLAPLDPESRTLPAPSDLMNRILIKVKKSSQSAEDLKAGEIFRRRRSNSHPSPYQRAVPLDNFPVPGSPLLSPAPGTRSNRQIETINEGEVHEAPSSSPSECESESEKDLARKTTSKINPILGNLGVYAMGIPFEGFDTPDAKLYNHIFSFKERTFAEKSQPGDPKRALYRHNMKYLMRVYPNATRFSSSNFDPLIYWKRGVQMAALNWQTFDLGMQLNQAMFDSGTDSSGYVLKPVEAREFQVMTNMPAGEVGKRPRKNVSVKIDVISAQQLMRPFNLGERRTVDPYVEVEVFLADDKRNKADPAANTFPTAQLKYRTKIVRENGFKPEFDGTHTFNVMTKYPDLIFVRWSVKLADSRGYNDKAPPIATFTAKLSSLKQGYRTLPLLDHNGDRYLFSTLFCRIKTDLTDIMVPYPEDVENVNKFKISRGVFRSNMSPKSSMDSGLS